MLWGEPYPKSPSRCGPNRWCSVKPVTASHGAPVFLLLMQIHWGCLWLFSCRLCLVVLCVCCWNTQTLQHLCNTSTAGSHELNVECDYYLILFSSPSLREECVHCAQYCWLISNCTTAVCRCHRPAVGAPGLQNSRIKEKTKRKWTRTAKGGLVKARSTKLKSRGKQSENTRTDIWRPASPGNRLSWRLH